MDDEFDRLNDEELASRLASEVGVSEKTARRAVASSDPDLGRSYALRVLRSRRRHRDGQEQLTTHRRNLRNIV